MSVSSLSLEKLEKICAKNPTSILFARLAEGFLQQGNVKRATEICRQGLRYRPSYVAGHVVMGKCHLTVGHFEEARQEFQKVLQLDADHPAALWHLGQIDLKLGWDDLALRHFEMALVLDPLNQKLSDQITLLKSGSVSSKAPTDFVASDQDETEAEADASDELQETVTEQERVENVLADNLDGEDVEELLVMNTGVMVPEVEHSDEEISDEAVFDMESAEKEPSGEDDLSALVSELQNTDQADLDDVTDDPNEADEVQEEKQPSCNSEPIATATLAELYAQQGLVDQAVATLKQVLARNPNNTQVQARLNELQS